MELYTSMITPKKVRETYDGEKLFKKQVDNSFDGYYVIVDDINVDIPMIIQKHTNPLNKNLHDLKAKYLDSIGDFMHIGNRVDVTHNDGNIKYYIAMTEPSSNGIYSEYKIHPISDDMTFNVDTPIAIKCSIADKGFYDDTSWIQEQSVFADKDLRAAIVQYNQETKKLTLFDDVFVNDNNYRIVKIDNHTLKEYDEEFGVLQLALIDVPFGTIACNGEVIKGVIMTARVKDKLLNSISRTLLCYHDKTKTGDYIDFTYDRDTKGKMVTDTYLVINNPTMESGYDNSLLYLCRNNVNMLTGKYINGVCETVNLPIYYEDNRVRIDKVTQTENIKIENSSYMVIMQHNETTDRIRSGKVKRLWINDDVYNVSGVDPFVTGLLSVGLNKGQIDTNDDDEVLKIANYKSQCEEIKGSVPQQGQIKEIDNEQYLYKGYENCYYLEGAGVGVTWSIDVSWCELRQDGLKCWLKFNDLKNVNKSIVLCANYGGNTFTKTIETRNM